MQNGGSRMAFVPAGHLLPILHFMVLESGGLAKDKEVCVQKHEYSPCAYIHIISYSKHTLVISRYELTAEVCVERSKKNS